MIKEILCTILLCVYPSALLAHDTPACPAPVLLGQVEIPNPTHFTVSGRYAYVIGDGCQVFTVDLEAPGFEIVDTLNCDGLVFDDIVVHGNAGYLTNRTNLIFTLDLTDPAHPQEGEFFLTNGTVFRPVIIGNYLYAGTSEIFDLSDPLHPVHAAYMNLPNPIAGMQHGLAYTTHMQPIDLTDPLNPVVDPDATDFSGSDYTHIDIDPDTNTLYASYNERLVAFDISDPSHPKTQYIHSIDTYYNSITPRIGSHLFVIDGYFEDKITLFDASQDGLSEVPLHLDLYGGTDEYARFIQLVDGVFYIDSSRSFSAYTISTSPYVAAHRTEGDTNDLLRHNNLVITSEEGFGIEIFDASDPAHLKLLAKYGGLDNVSAVAALGDTLYLAADRDDLIVLDITDPASPSLIRTIDTGRRARDAVVVDDTLFVVDRTSGLSIFDITDPTDPQLRSSLDTPGWNEDISFSDDHQLACIACGRFDALILDMSDLDHPRVISTITPLDQSNSGIQTTTFDGALLYTPEFAEGYRIWDIAEPAAPALLAHHQFSYYDEVSGWLNPIAYQITPHHNQLLISNGNNGLAIYKNTNPLAPVFDHYFSTHPTSNTTASVRRIAMDDNLAYAAVYGGGLKVFNTAPCTPCQADLNSDGVLDFFDLSLFLTAFANQDPLADLNNDGVYNYFDVSLIFNLFTAGCP